MPHADNHNTSNSAGDLSPSIGKKEIEMMLLALYIGTAIAFYAFMVNSAQVDPENQSVSPLLQVVDGGAQDELRRAA